MDRGRALLPWCGVRESSNRETRRLPREKVMEEVSLLAVLVVDGLFARAVETNGSMTAEDVVLTALKVCSAGRVQGMQRDLPDIVLDSVSARQLVNPPAHD